VLQLLALDFDGVISDSAPESFVVGLLTYLELVSDSGYRNRLAGVSEKRAPLLASVTSDPLYDSFIALMPLGNRAEDFGVVFRALDAGELLVEQQDYDRWRATIDPAWLESFHARFYEIRTELSTNDPRGWRRLMSPYPSFVELLRRRSADAILTIATAKDRRSVEILLEDYGIADLFPSARVLDKEAGVRKDRHIATLRDSFGVPFEQMLFIDDKLNHLEVVAKLGVRCGLAGWGYNGAREAESARGAGHAVFELATVESMLFGPGVEVGR
jgi:phosphoglycolate phosphatase-like HAD superfamily hydrolase